MSGKVKNAIRCTVYLAVVLVIIFRVQSLLVPRRDLPEGTDRPNRKFEGFYAEPEDSIEVLFFGSSHMLDGMSPMRIYEETGIRSFNFGTLQQPLPVSLLLLREAFRTQTPKVVVMDASGLFFTQAQNVEQARWTRVLDGIPLTKVQFRTEMMQEFLSLRGDNKYSILSVAFPIINYHDNLGQLGTETLEWEDAGSPMYAKGHNIPQNRIPVTKPEDGTSGSDKETLKQNKNYIQNLEYLEKMKKLCEKHGCELILTKVPTGISSEEYATAWTAAKNEVIREKAAEMGLRYIDIYTDGAGINWSVDTADGGEHLNERGAIKVSHFVAQWLRENCVLEEGAAEEITKAWKEQARIYDMHSNIALLRLTFVPKDFFTRLAEGNYTLLCAVSETLEARGWTQEISDRFISLTGAETPMTGSSQEAYAIVSSDGTRIAEKKDSKQCALNGALPDGKAYSVTSRSGRAGGGASILIDDVEYAGNNRGIYIISYDNDLHCVVDIARIDSSSASVTVAHNTDVNYKNIYYQAIFDATRKKALPEISIRIGGVGIVTREKWAEQTEVLQEGTPENIVSLPEGTAAKAKAYRDVLNAEAAVWFRTADLETTDPAFLIRDQMMEAAPPQIIWETVAEAEEYRYTVKELDGFPNPTGVFESGRIVAKGTTKNDTYLELSRNQAAAGKWLRIRVTARAEGMIQSEVVRYLYVDGMPETATPAVFPREGGKEGDTFTVVVRTGLKAKGVAIAYLQRGVPANAKEYTKETEGVTVYTEGSDMYWFIQYPFKAEEKNLYRTTLIRVTEDGKNWGAPAESLPFAVAAGSK